MLNNCCFQAFNYLLELHRNLVLNNPQTTANPTTHVGTNPTSTTPHSATTGLDMNSGISEVCTNLYNFVC